MVAKKKDQDQDPVVNQTINKTVTVNRVEAASASNKNGLGTAALVLGIIGIVFAFIPFLDFGSGIIPLIGLILGLVGLTHLPKKPAVIGSIVAGVGVVLSIIMMVTYIAIFFNAAKQVEKDNSAPVSVIYSVTGSGSDASVTYSTYTNGSSGTNQATSVALPFSKTVTGTKGWSNYALTATNGQNDTGDISCKITVAGKVVSTQTSSGAFATVACSATGTSD